MHKRRSAQAQHIGVCQVETCWQVCSRGGCFWASTPGGAAVVDWFINVDPCGSGPAYLHTVIITESSISHMMIKQNINASNIRKTHRNHETALFNEDVFLLEYEHESRLITAACLMFCHHREVTFSCRKPPGTVGQIQILKKRSSKRDLSKPAIAEGHPSGAACVKCPFLTDWFIMNSMSYRVHDGTSLPS